MKYNLWDLRKVLLSPSLLFSHLCMEWNTRQVHFWFPFSLLFYLFICVFFLLLIILLIGLVWPGIIYFWRWPWMETRHLTLTWAKSRYELGLNLDHWLMAPPTTFLCQKTTSHFHLTNKRQQRFLSRFSYGVQAFSMFFSPLLLMIT